MTVVPLVCSSVADKAFRSTIGGIEPLRGERRATAARIISPSAPGWADHNSAKVPVVTAVATLVPDITVAPVPGA
jgi:hypothetical protein